MPSLFCSPSLPTTGKNSQNMLLVLTHSNWPWSQGTGWHFNACKESTMLYQGNWHTFFLNFFVCFVLELALCMCGICVYGVCVCFLKERDTDSFPPSLSLLCLSLLSLFWIAISTYFKLSLLFFVCIYVICICIDTGENRYPFKNKTPTSNDQTLDA